MLNSHSRFVNLTFFIALGIATVFLFTNGLDQQATRSAKALWDMGHVLYFILFCHAWFKVKWVQQQRYFVLFISTMLITLVLGTLIELLQYPTSREPDSWDIAHDVLGSLIALTFHPYSRKQAALWLKVSTFILFIVSLVPLGMALFDEIVAKLQFPVLADFSTPLEYTRFAGESLAQQNSQLKVTFSTAKYSSFSLQYFAHDWSQYNYLRLRFNNPSNNPLILNIKIHDLKHTQTYDFNDRFNAQVVLKPGENSFTLSLNAVKQAPKQRLMNMHNIVQLQFFTHQLTQSRTLFFNEVRLD